MSSRAASERRQSSSTSIERQKRLVLSCTRCRSRKVKCDRVKPCGACCVRGEPSLCTYSTEDAGDFEAVSQAYEIRKLRSEVKKWKDMAIKLRTGGGVAARSGGGPTVGETSSAAAAAGISMQEDDEEEGSPISASDIINEDAPTVTSSKPVRQAIRNGSESGASLPSAAAAVENSYIKIKKEEEETDGNQNDGLYFGAPGMSTVIAEFTNMQLKQKFLLRIPKASDIFNVHKPPPFPFPTLWPQVDGLRHVLACLPPMDTIGELLHCFRRRAQCAYPFVYEELQRPEEIVAFLRNPEENADRNPGILAMIFIAMAIGTQVTVYERSGDEWRKDDIHAERRTSELFYIVAAAMQTLRTMSYMNRPNLLVLQTLLMMIPYLTNSGRFTDGWVVLGIIIRIAQSMGFHRNPELLDPKPTEHQAHIRRVLWWWIHYQDVHFSMTLGRPLGVSGIGDSPPPADISPQPATLQEYILPYTIILRQVLSSNDLSEDKIDQYTDQLLRLHAFLPERIRFNERVWLQDDFNMPPWPLPMQAVLHCTKVHSFVVVLNRRKKSQQRRRYISHWGGDSCVWLTSQERVLHSARMVLHCQKMVHTKIREGMLCWTQNQQSFNAAMIIGLHVITNPNAPETASDIQMIRESYARYEDMEKSGLHELAGIAKDNMGKLLAQVEKMVDAQSIKEVTSATEASNNLINQMEDVVMSDSGIFIPDLLTKKGEMCATNWFELD